MRILFLILSLLILVTSSTFAQKQGKVRTKIIYKYKKEEYFDLGQLYIKGNISSPGDLSVKFRKRKGFRYSFPNREHFDPEVSTDLVEIE
jgi:hypothetical protein